MILYVALIYPINAHASVWIPKTNEYKYYTSFSIIDKRSENKKIKWADLFVKDQEMIHKLTKRQNAIKAKADDENRSLFNHEIAELNDNAAFLKEFKEYKMILGSLGEDKTSNFELEYGINDHQSLGMKIGYKTDNFLRSITPHYTEQKTGKDFELFYKYQLLKQEGWIVAISPSLQYSTYTGCKPYRHFDLALMAGKSRLHKNNYTLFYEFGASVHAHSKENSLSKTGFTLFMTDGIRFANNVIITNYMKYEQNRFKNYAHNKILYEQISIAKEIYFGNLSKQSFTIQVGYFAKGSLVARGYNVSGFIFSLWFSL
ncbi:MAG: hypothetical protein COA94_03905 [Rickettsiales bacterium]|nr:MAG: hypothetical protein COA94_03905 [Rickettsiales bacterium]